jgi:hypothetical protein
LYINGEPKSLPQFIEELLQLIPEIIVNSEINFKKFEFGNLNKVDVDFIYDYEVVSDGKKNLKRKVLELEFELVKSEFGGFEIKGCYIK